MIENEDEEQIERLNSRIAELLAEVAALKRQAQTVWQPIDTIPQDRPIDGWHSIWKCPVTVSYRSWVDRSAWVEKTMTTEWPIEAFTHWRETSEAPELTSAHPHPTENIEPGA